MQTVYLTDRWERDLEFTSTYGFSAYDLEQFTDIATVLGWRR